MGAPEGAEGFQQGVDAAMMELAQGTIDALATGDIEMVTELLEKLDDVPTDEDILELIEGNVEIPESNEVQSSTSGDGITWIYGTSGDDTLEGTANSDYIMGLAGNDILDGEAGADTLYGDDGNDTIYGYEGNDVISGGSGNDTISGDCGNDVLDGGSGIDFLSYAGNPVDVYVNWTTHMSSSFYNDESHVDTFQNFEGVIGSSLGGMLIGDSSDNIFIGGGGNDSITGGGGDDRFYYDSAGQGEGNDTIIGFESGHDEFKFDSNSFSGTYTFESVASYDGSSAGGSGAYFVYAQDDDQLYYDSDGSGANVGELIATIQGDEVVSGDIVVS